MSIDEILALLKANEVQSKIVTIWVLMTRQLAAALLSLPVVNRNRSTAIQHNYEKTIKSGKWVENPHGIIIGADGSRYDGDHRLNAIVKTGVPAVMCVHLNFPPENWHCLDRGKARTVADQIKIIFDGVLSAKDACFVCSWASIHRILGEQVAHRALTVEEVQNWYCDSKETAEYGITLHKRISTRSKRKDVQQKILHAEIGKAPVMGALTFLYSAVSGISTHVENLCFGDPGALEPLRDHLVQSAVNKNRDERQILSRKVLNAVLAATLGKPVVLSNDNNGLEYCAAMLIKNA